LNFKYRLCESLCRVFVAKKINNKKVIIRNKEVAVTKVKFEYWLSLTPNTKRQTINNKQFVNSWLPQQNAIKVPPWGI